MSPRLSRITARELITILKKDGFVFVRAKGSHRTFFHPLKKLHVTIPVHHGKVIGAGLLHAILKQAQISKDFL